MGAFDKFLADIMAPLESSTPRKDPTPRERVAEGLRDASKAIKPAMVEVFAGKSIIQPETLLAMQRLKKNIRLKDK